MLGRKIRVASLSIHCHPPTACAHTHTHSHTLTHTRTCKYVPWLCVPEGTGTELTWNTHGWSIPVTEIATYKYPVPNVLDLPKFSLLFQLKSSKDTVLGWGCSAFRLPGLWAILTGKGAFSTNPKPFWNATGSKNDQEQSLHYVASGPCTLKLSLMTLDSPGTSQCNF